MSIYTIVPDTMGGARVQCESKMAFEKAIAEHGDLQPYAVRTHYYPSEIPYLPTEETKIEVFCYHYFCDEYREVGYWNPELGAGRIFKEPRDWHPVLLAQLEDPEVLI